MKKIKYIIKRIFSMNYKQMFEKINEIHNKTGKNKIYLIFDIVLCGIKYQAGYMDYWLFEMYNMNNSQRKTVLTRGINNTLIKKYNNSSYTHIFDNKDEFLLKFKKYVKRDFLILSDNNYDDFINFAKKHNEFIAKPRNGSCGKGIKKIKINNNYKKTYNDLLNDNLIVLEELITQNNVLDELNPSSINTIRMVTINDKKSCHAIVAYLRIGNGKFVDNFNSGGMVVPIEIESGEIKYPALDKTNHLYDVHPTTKTKIKGFKIPNWNEIIKLAEELGKIIPEVGIVGWDIALSDKGPVIVEGNDFPGHDIYGLPPHRTDNIGVLPKFEKYLK